MEGGEEVEEFRQIGWIPRNVRLWVDVLENVAINVKQSVSDTVEPPIRDPLR